MAVFAPAPRALAARGNTMSNQTHVLYLIDSLSGWAGAEGALLKIARRLPSRYRCSIATFRTKPFIGSLDQFGCPVHVFPLERTYDWSALKTALRLRSLIQQQQIRIVHTFFETSDLWGGIVARLSGCPILVSSRRDMGILRGPKHRVAYRLFTPMFDQVHAVSNQVRDFCIETDGLDPRRVVTVANGIDLDLVNSTNGAAALRARLGLNGASHLLVTVGHVRRVKGIDILLKAAPAVCRQFPQAVFLIVGGVLEQDHRDYLHQLVRDSGLQDNVRFLGDPTREVGFQGDSRQIFSILKMSDVFCLTSRSEGMSNALLEAMACGLPCIATRVGGNPEVVADGESGFIVPTEDPGAVAARIIELLSRPELARGMGQAGRRRIQQSFSADAMVERVVDCYDDLLAARCPEALS